MIIKYRPVITWLLNPDKPDAQKGLTIAHPQNPINNGILHSEFTFLEEIRAKKPNWGLPELVMQSFKQVMEKSAPAFEKIMPKLITEFGENDECGILIFSDTETLVYGFGDNQLNMWVFKEQNGNSTYYFSAEYKIIGGQPKLYITDSILSDNNLLLGTIQERIDAIGARLQFIAMYVAVKKYIKVETVVIRKGLFTEIDDTPLAYVDKGKVINKTGQEIIVMDSKWFRKIINDNDINVRGYFRMISKNRPNELIFVNPHVRHGYHRDAKLEQPDNKPECAN